MSSEADVPNAAGGKTPVPPENGTPFGRFRLLDRIGAGDVAEVFRAIVVGVQGFERRVAIKVMRDDVTEAAAGQVFAEEARVSALLDHPGVVQVYEFGVIEGAPFIAMEYLRGRNLEEVMTALRAQGERMPPGLAVWVAQEVAAALAHAHDIEDNHGRSLGIVHGDVKPANIMLVREGAVKLLDFGVARVTVDHAAVKRNGRSLPRQLCYLSPEQALGRAIDSRTDLFSLGVVLWEMLTGRSLFAGASDKATLSKLKQGEIPPPSRFAPDIPPSLDRAVLAALTRDLDRRFRSAADLGQALEEAALALPNRHGDLTALLDRLWGNPRETGSTRTLAGEPGPSPKSGGVPALGRPPRDRRLTPLRREIPEKTPTTRLMGDTTLAAILAKEPRRRPGRRGRLFGDPRALLVGVGGLAIGLLLAAAFLTGRSKLGNEEQVVDQRPPAATPAPIVKREPAPAATALVVAPCVSPDAGPPCWTPPPPAETTSAPPGRTERRSSRPSRSATEGRSSGTPSPRSLDDRRPNPFDE